MPIETTLNINSIGRNEIKEGSMAVVQHIANLCNMKPGNDVYNPDKGLNLRSYKGSIVSDSLKNEIEDKLMEQILKYTPYMVQFVRCEIINDILYLFVGIPGVEDIMLLSGQEFEISSLEFVKLND